MSAMATSEAFQIHCPVSQARGVGVVFVQFQPSIFLAVRCKLPVAIQNLLRSTHLLESLLVSRRKTLEIISRGGDLEIQPRGSTSDSTSSSTFLSLRCAPAICTTKISGSAQEVRNRYDATRHHDTIMQRRHATPRSAQTPSSRHDAVDTTTP